MTIEVMMQTAAETRVSRQVQTNRSSSQTGFADVMGQKLMDNRANSTTSAQRKNNQFTPKKNQAPENVDTAQDGQAGQSASSTTETTASAEKPESKEPILTEETEKPEEAGAPNGLNQTDPTLLINLLAQLQQLLEAQGELTEEISQLAGKVEEQLLNLEGLDGLQLTQLTEDLKQLLALTSASLTEIAGGSEFSEQLQQVLNTLDLADDFVLDQDVKQLLEDKQKTAKSETIFAAETTSKTTSKITVSESPAAEVQDLPVDQELAETTAFQPDTEEADVAQGKVQANQDTKLEASSQTKTAEPTLPQILVSGQKADIQPVLEAQAEVQQLEAQQIIEQIVNRAELVFKDGTTEMKLQLTPENLGSIFVKISLDLEKNNMSAKLYAENAQVKELIQNNLDQLKINLGEKGINISSLEVSVGQDSQDPYQEQSFYQYQQSVKNLAYNRGNVQIGGVIYQETEQRSNPYQIHTSFDALA